MKQIEFNHLNEDEQLNTLLQSGFVIGIRNDSHYCYSFYCLDNFFAEIKYEGDSIKSIRSFRGSKQLALYTSKSSMHLRHAS